MILTAGDKNTFEEEKSFLREVFERQDRDGSVFYVYNYDQRYYKVLSACAKLRLKTKNLPEGNPHYIEIKGEDWARVMGIALDSKPESKPEPASANTQQAKDKQSGDNDSSTSASTSIAGKTLDSKTPDRLSNKIDITQDAADTKSEDIKSGIALSKESTSSGKAGHKTSNTDTTSTVVNDNKSTDAEAAKVAQKEAKPPTEDTKPANKPKPVFSFGRKSNTPPTKAEEPAASSKSSPSDEDDVDIEGAIEDLVNGNQSKDGKSDSNAGNNNEPKNKPENEIKSARDSKPATSAGSLYRPDNTNDTNAKSSATLTKPAGNPDQRETSTVANTSTAQDNFKSNRNNDEKDVAEMANSLGGESRLEAIRSREQAVRSREQAVQSREDNLETQENEILRQQRKIADKLDDLKQQQKKIDDLEADVRDTKAAVSKRKKKLEELADHIKTTISGMQDD